MKLSSVCVGFVLIESIFNCVADACNVTFDPFVVPVRDPSSYPDAVTSIRPADSDVIVSNHWSEAVTLPRPTPPASSVWNAADSTTACPYNQSGLLHWHQPNTWTSGTVPTANGSDVHIPPNTRILVSSCSLLCNDTNPYGIIYVPSSSRLIFNDNNISMHAKGFNIEGHMQLGSQSCRLKSYVTVTLHGSRYDQTFPTSEHVKGVFVHNSGTLDVHGQQYFPTWTRLATSAYKGSTRLFVQDFVNWEVGQRVVVVSTALKDARDWHQNEVHSIKSVLKASHVGPNVGYIELTEPLKYNHYGGREYQAEVALLSRRIIFQGNANTSEPTDTSPISCKDDWWSSYPCENTFLTGFGGHIMITGPNATGRVAGVELFRMGQTNVLARYPMHYHLVADGGYRSYVSDISVHHSFFRCVAVHGTNGVNITSNVAYDAIGHCFYLEDGVEENNNFEHNLAAHIHIIGYPNSRGSGQFLQDVEQRPELVLPADTTASPFYITNSYNTFIGNVAAGGWSGYALVSLPRPIQLHRHVKMTPNARPTKVFDGNTAHSTAFWWSDAGAVYVGGLLEHPNSSDYLRYNAGRQIAGRQTCAVDPINTNGWCSAENSRWTIFRNTKTFLVNGRGVQHWGTRPELLNFEAHDVGLSANVFGSAWVNAMLINCRSMHTPDVPCSGICKWRESRYFHQMFAGFQWYDVGQTHIVTNSTFRNCDGTRQCRGCFSNSFRASAAFTLLTHSDQFVPEFMQATRNILYQNVTPGLRWNFRTRPSQLSVSGRLSNWLDVDGSVCGRNGRTLMGSTWANNWWKLDGNCSRSVGKEDMWLCDAGGIREAGSIVLRHNETLTKQVGTTICGNGNGLPCPAIGFATHVGRGGSNGSLVLTGNGRITGPTGGIGWYVKLDAGAPTHATIREVQVSPHSPLLLVLPYPSNTVFRVFAKASKWCNPKWYLCAHNFTSTNSITDVRSSSDRYYFDGSYLYIRIVQQPDSSLGRNTWRGVAPIGDLPTFERSGIRMLRPSDHYQLEIYASCPNTQYDAMYCQLPTSAATAPDLCANGLETLNGIRTYDKCASQIPSPSGTTGGSSSTSPVSTASSSSNNQQSSPTSSPIVSSSSNTGSGDSESGC